MSVFNVNSNFARFMSRAVDVLELNILWMIFSLPLFTIGASTCAAYYVTLKMVDEEEGYIGKMFVKAFKDNFKQGTLMWLITAVCGYLCYLIWQAISKGDDVNFLIIVGAIIFTAIVIAINFYTYPIIARYENTLKKSIMNSIVICTLYFGRTLITLAITALEFVIIFWNKWTVLAGILIGPEFVIYTISGFAKKIFLDSEKNGGAIIPPVVAAQQALAEEDESDEDDEETDETDETDDESDDDDEVKSDDNDTDLDEKSDEE